MADTALKALHASPHLVFTRPIISAISHKQWGWPGLGDLPGCGSHLGIAIGEEWGSTMWGPMSEPQKPKVLPEGHSFTGDIMDQGPSHPGGRNEGNRVKQVGG